MLKLKVLFKFIFCLLVCLNLLAPSLAISTKTSQTAKLILLADYENTEQNDSDEEEKKDELEAKAFESIIYASRSPSFTWSKYTVSISHHHKTLTSSYYASIDIPPSSLS